MSDDEHQDHDLGEAQRLARAAELARLAIARDVPTVPALLRAALAGDEAGVDAIVHTTHPLALIMLLVSWCNTMRGRADFGTDAEFDDYLGAVQRRMLAEAAGGDVG
jgi:hypothetical protein